jgi:hypothetical protein
MQQTCIFYPTCAKESTSTWGTPHKVQNSTLPLTEEGVSHQAHLVSEVYMFAPWQGLGENNCNLVICRYILQLNYPSLNPITNEVVPDLNMLRPIMKHWILREFYATLIITVNDDQWHLLTKQTNQYLTKPNGLATGLTGRHILCLC